MVNKYYTSRFCQHIFSGKNGSCSKIPFRTDVSVIPIISVGCKNTQTCSYVRNSCTLRRWNKKVFLLKVLILVVEKSEQIVWVEKKKLKFSCKNTTEIKGQVNIIFLHQYVLEEQILPSRFLFSPMTFWVASNFVFSLWVSHDPVTLLLEEHAIVTWNKQLNKMLYVTACERKVLVQGVSWKNVQWKYFNKRTWKNQSV